MATPLQPVEVDPWQDAFDTLFEEKFSLNALEDQSQSVVSLRQEAVQFLRTAENVLGFQEAARYAAQICMSHPHLSDGVADFLPASNNEAPTDTAAKNSEIGDRVEPDSPHDESSCKDCKAGRRCQKK